MNFWPSLKPVSGNASKLVLSILLSNLMVCSTGIALPIGYGYNQSTLQFDEIQDPDFRVYYDARTPNDAKTALNSLKAAKPILEDWLKVQRSSPLIVNMSAASDNASFANFITDSIELQTLGNGSRDLAWHEYTHSMMYRHLDNFFGPAGALMHLPWMEAWFLEGLAEATSVSVGSEFQASIERYQALTGDWPTWDRIHSLYTSGPFSERGYATSGAFVAWLLRTYGTEKMVESLRTFRSDTMPWYWVWAFTPFNGFWPMDTMLQNWTGHKGRDLYEQYKLAASAQWAKATPDPFIASKDQNSLKFASYNGIIEHKGQIFALQRMDDHFYLKGLDLRKKSVPIANFTKVKRVVAHHDNLWATTVAMDDTSHAYISDYWPETNKKIPEIIYTQGKLRQKLPRDVNWIHNLWIAANDIWWTETILEESKLCFAPKTKFATENVQCVNTKKHPEVLHGIGVEQDLQTGQAKKIWIKSTRQTMLEDMHSVTVVDTASKTQTEFPFGGGGHPKSMAMTPTGNWMLVADFRQKFLRRYATSGECLESIALTDVATKILPSTENRPWLVTWIGEDHAVTLPGLNRSTGCQDLQDHKSPMLIAMRNKGKTNFQDAINLASTWSTAISKDQREIISETKKKLSTIESTDGEHATVLPESQSSEWRGRPIFALPWIGADDAFGPQIGIVSVPLMDHLQNETLRVTAMLGVNSIYPYQEAALTTTRWKPTWNFAVYRSQTYNGRYRDTETNEIFSSFLDEKGVRIDGDIGFERKHSYLGLSWGARTGHLAKYIGEARNFGQFVELFSNASWTRRFAEKWTFNLTTQGKTALKYLNEKFEYETLGASSLLSRKLYQGRLDLGLEGSRTRGPLRRDLQEMYTPLKTFVPGSGGGYNKNSYAITTDYGLFSPRFGDTQARSRMNFTHPIIEDLDKFTSLVYIERLDFSAFLNHGTAWRGDKLPDQDLFMTAHGYNVDLLMNNKGVRFNLGSGIGQVIGTNWQLYATAGFDAFF
ncbi:MAG: hypothetical protein NT027_15890 [Proteobacteria bacterium]|nr:hypothetical protein [Pseudomonadota bacterium]